MPLLTFAREFKDIPDDLKPREKLAKYGPEMLRLWELVALILRTGERHKGGYFEDVGQLARRLVSEAGFKGLFTQKAVPDLQENFEIHKGHAEIIVAISEIGRRLHGKYDVFDVSEPTKVFSKFKHLQKAKQEQCHILHLDDKKRCIYQEMVAVGGRDNVIVSPNDVLRTAIWLGTSQIMVIHNHMTSSQASQEDVEWTLAIAKGAWELHRIRLVDHVIVGSDGYFSFLEKGLL
jgi:DNA repair protein RadC